MISSRRSWVAGITAICIVSIAAPAERAFAQASNVQPDGDVSGLWTGSRSYFSFSSEFSFEIRQTGDKIAGVARYGLSPSGLGGTGGPLEGAKVGQTITFQVLGTDFTGKLQLSGDEMIGSMFGPYHPFDIVLRKQK